MRVAIVEGIGISEAQAQRLAAEKLRAGTQLAYFPARTTDPETLIERAKGAEVVVLTNLPWQRELILRCPELKMIAVAFTGYDHIDMDCCNARGILVSNCAGYSNEAVSELVFGFAISFYRQLQACDAAVRSGGTRAGLLGAELSGKTFGVIGTGAIGAQVAKIAAAFGCKVLAYSRTVKPALGIPFVGLDELLSQSDIVSIHVPSNSSTKGMIGAREIALMKKNALLINTARGPIVDSGALAQALQEARIAGACLDVFETEPPIPETHPLLHAKHTLLAPHVGFATAEALEKRASIVFDNIAAYQNGHAQNLCH